MWECRNAWLPGSNKACRAAKGLQALIRLAGQQRLCRPWEGLKGSKGSAVPGKGCRAAQALQALGRAAEQGLQPQIQQKVPIQTQLYLSDLTKTDT